MPSFDPKKITKIHQNLHSHLPSDPALRVKALETILVEKGMVKSENIDKWVEVYADDIGPKRGAHVVARAWIDPEFKTRLLEDGSKAVDEMGFAGPASGHLKAVENTSDSHNIVVCTLCSCYPFAILGMAPNWYKTAAYRSRVVREPRAVLAEFGVELSEDTAVHVWDSTAELRYLVIPQRPAGTKGMTQDELAKLVTRNSMIGTDRDLKTGGA
ncbi:MAG: nitrile hydratase subunit alpha [Amylibacter sp.]|nr:nitrile hydratase subunit alpha [Amylibacter sp.]